MEQQKETRSARRNQNQNIKLKNQRKKFKPESHWPQVHHCRRPNPRPRWRHRRHRTLAPATPPTPPPSPPPRSMCPRALGDPSSRASLPSRTPPVSWPPSPTSSASTSASPAAAGADAQLFRSRFALRPRTLLGKNSLRRLACA